MVIQAKWSIKRECAQLISRFRQKRNIISNVRFTNLHRIIIIDGNFILLDIDSYFEPYLQFILI